MSVRSRQFAAAQQSAVTRDRESVWGQPCSSAYRMGRQLCSDGQRQVGYKSISIVALPISSSVAI